MVLDPEPAQIRTRQSLTLLYHECADTEEQEKLKQNRLEENARGKRPKEEGDDEDEVSWHLGVECPAD